MTPLVIKQVSYINYLKPVSSLQFDDIRQGQPNKTMLGICKCIVLDIVSSYVICINIKVDNTLSNTSPKVWPVHHLCIESKLLLAERAL